MTGVQTCALPILVFALADRVAVMVYGRVIAVGSTSEVRANPEVRRAYLGEDAPA